MRIVYLCWLKVQIEFLDQLQAPEDLFSSILRQHIDANKHEQHSDVPATHELGLPTDLRLPKSLDPPYIPTPCSYIIGHTPGMVSI